MNIFTETVQVGQRTISFETGKLAKQASSIVMSCGETNVLVTAVSSTSPRDLPFLPLTVEYRESNAAAGKIPGGYFKREGRPTEKEILTCRLTDRPIRPLFPKTYRCETQIIANVLSHDKQNEPDVMAITGASAALMLSDAPWAGPIAGIRVGRIDGEFIALPTWDEIARSELNLVIAASRDAIVMVEAGCTELSESVMIDALMFAKDALQPLLDAQIKLREQAGVPKRSWVDPDIDEAFAGSCMDAGREGVTTALAIRGKHERHLALRAATDSAAKKLLTQFPAREDEIRAALSGLEKQIVRNATVNDHRRVDGRGLRDIRPIYIEAHPYERPHGSALFQRGETQAIVTTTLGPERDGQRLDTIRGDVTRRFMLHYNFPPFCTGEAKPMRGTSRRETGHGALAERALLPIMPSNDDFPYTIRIVSDTLESNGSSSMAAVCGGCLSLMDAGVPIKSPVAGIAMGLIQEGEKFAVLSDILGDEDHLGDMDFKVTGTRAGITALQMDIKVQGLTRKVLEDALAQACEGRLHILDKMADALPEARADLSRYAPRIETMQVKVDKIRSIIGPGGKVIRGIIEQTGCAIDIDDAGRISIASDDMAAIDSAKKIIEGLTFEPTVGEHYAGVVKRVVDFGAFVEFMPGTDGLVHVSELENKRVEKVTDVVREGDDVVVKIISIDDNGRVRLSRKAAFGVDPDDVKNLRA
ncbi:MAG: polyribonucleotide nucleotidyltransferase [Nannocystaceae bacterium]